MRRLTADTIRGLAMDAAQKANSGHPGMPMGMADAAVVLWTRFLKHNPADSLWADRDRFILSAVSDLCRIGKCGRIRADD